mgnify:CR=1 FL=1
MHAVPIKRGMMAQSGFDALIEALKQSGINMDGRFDADPSDAPSGSGAATGAGASGPKAQG